MHVHACECIWVNDKYLSKDHAHSISKHSRTSTLRLSACNCPQSKGSRLGRPSHPDKDCRSPQTELTVLVSLLSFALSQKSRASQKHPTPDWVELVYSQGNKAEQSQQTHTRTRQREKQDGHVPKPASRQTEDKPSGSPTDSRRAHVRGTLGT